MVAGVLVVEAVPVAEVVRPVPLLASAASLPELVRLLPLVVGVPVAGAVSTTGVTGVAAVVLPHARSRLEVTGE